MPICFAQDLQALQCRQRVRVSSSQGCFQRALGPAVLALPLAAIGMAGHPLPRPPFSVDFYCQAQWRRLGCSRLEGTRGP